MNIFSRIGEALDGDVIWHEELGTDAGRCGETAWCDGEHPSTSGEVFHARRVVTATRQDGTVVLAVGVRQPAETVYRCQPDIYMGGQHSGEAVDEVSLALDEHDARSLGDLVYHVGDGSAGGKRVWNALMTASYLLISKETKQHLPSLTHGDLHAGAFR